MKFIIAAFLLISMIVAIKSEWARVECPCAATWEYRPLCGNDNKSYESESILRCANKCHKSDVKRQHWGVCPQDAPERESDRGQAVFVKA